MKNYSRRVKALECVFKMPPIKKQTPVVVMRAMERLETGDLIVLDKLVGAAERGEAQSQTAAQAEAMTRWTAILEEECRREGYASWKEYEKKAIPLAR